MKSKFESIQEIRKDGYPKVTELRAKHRFKTNPKEADYNEPLSALKKEYKTYWWEEKQTKIVGVINI